MDERAFWESLRISRLPLSWILSRRKRAGRTSMRAFSNGAFVHRMHDLFFVLRQTEVLERLTEEERKAAAAFEAAWNSLPWTALVTHPHISEVSDAELASLIPSARRLDRCLALRTSEEAARDGEHDLSPPQIFLG